MIPQFSVIMTSLSCARQRYMIRATSSSTTAAAMTISASSSSTAISRYLYSTTNIAATAKPAASSMYLPICIINVNLNTNNNNTSCIYNDSRLAFSSSSTSISSPRINKSGNNNANTKNKRPLSLSSTMISKKKVAQKRIEEKKMKKKGRTLKKLLSSNRSRPVFESQKQQRHNEINNKYNINNTTSLPSKDGTTFASSITDKWDNDNDNDNDNEEMTTYSSSYYTDDIYNNNSVGGNYQLKRFRNRRKECYRIFEEYRNFWYPGDNKNEGCDKDDNDNDNDNDNDDNNNWKRVVTTFQHPDPDSPWTTWDKVIESEDLFRKVCSSNHDLFVSCASYLTDHQSVHHTNNYVNHNYVNYHHHHHPTSATTNKLTISDNTTTANNNNNDYLRQSRAYLMNTVTITGNHKTTTTNNNVSNTNDNNNSNNDDIHDSGNNEKEYWNDDDLFRSDCEELLRTILPFWETIRRERAVIVERCRPKPTPLMHTEQQTKEQQQQKSLSFPPLDPIDMRMIIEKNEREHIMKEQEQHQQHIDNNGNDKNWVGWLRTVITGNELSSSAIIGGGDNDDNNTNDNNFNSVVTAHLDPEYAPNHYHYLKVVGRLYFHYLPLELHNRFRQYNKYITINNDNDDDDRETNGNFTNLPAGGYDYDDYDDDDYYYDDDNGNDIGDDGNGIYANGYLPPTPAWERKRIEILQQRAEQIQYIVDQSLLPIASSPYNNDDAVDIKRNDYKNNNSNVITDKIIRLLIRSYLDINSLEAAHQAERVYHRHPQYRKGLLWFVTMCYLRRITPYTNNKIPGEKKETKDNSMRRRRYPDSEHHKEAAIAAERICKLVFSKHAKDSREFNHCSTVAFEALARLPSRSRNQLRGYYERVHSLGIMKFGPKVWEALICEDDSNTTTTSATGGVDLSQALHAKDHKIISYLIQIYSNDHIYFDRAIRLLDLSFDLYSTRDLQESISQSTFHQLIKKLAKQKSKAYKREQWEENKEKSGKTPRRSYSNNIISELETVFRVLDKMVLHEKWFPNHETFRHLFHMTLYCDNPGPVAERLRAKFEACRFLSSMSSSSSLSSNNTFDNEFESFSNTPHLSYSPVKASMYTLNAWLQTAHNNEGLVLLGEPNPAERAWQILRALRVGSSPLFLPIEKVISRSLYDPDHIPDDALYALVLMVCSRVKSSQSFDIALDVFDIVQKEDILLEGNVCTSLIQVISNSSDLYRRIEWLKIVYLAIIEENPNFDDIKPAVAHQLGKQFSYFRTRHPELYESHLAELKFESTYPRHHTENSNSHDTSTESGDNEDLGSIKI